MSNSLNLNRLVDNGFYILVFRNKLGSVTACCPPKGKPEPEIEFILDDADDAGCLTEASSVGEAVKLLADKIQEVGRYGEDDSETT